jgi:hypothetical protein
MRWPLAPRHRPTLQTTAMRMLGMFFTLCDRVVWARKGIGRAVSMSGVYWVFMRNG